MTCTNNVPLTKVFAKAELDNVTSAMYKHQQRFGLDVQFSALVHNFNFSFSNRLRFRAGQAMNSSTAASHRRYLLCYSTSYANQN